MTMLRASFVAGAVLPFLLAASGCGLLKKGDKDAGATADTDAAAVVAEVADAAPSASAAPSATVVAGIATCKAGDVADCTNKCTNLKSQPSYVVLGLMFQSGNGVGTDKGKATTLFQGACNAGSGSGCENFGLALRSGSGIIADPPRAGDTFKKGCDLRNA